MKPFAPLLVSIALVFPLAAAAGFGAPGTDAPFQVAAVKKPAKKPAKKANGPAERRPFTEQDQAIAEIPGIPGARFFGDDERAFFDALPKQPGPWLALSTGGSGGAYGSGVLYGWSQSGQRPDFAVVTGVSIGALMAPYVFAGKKYDAELRDAFTTISGADIFEDSGRKADALLDTWPLRDTITRRVTPALLADIAAEHKKGRRLFVVTANLDAERPVVWNMGAIAAHGGEDGLKLFRQVLVAAAAIPGVFPPVLVDVQAKDKRFDEMHVDGGVFGPFFVAPETVIGDPNARLPATKLYVIVNSKLSPEFYMAERNMLSILSRTIAAALKAGAKAEIAILAPAMQRQGIEFNVTYVDNDFDKVSKSNFDREFMQALFELGVERGKSGQAFRTQKAQAAEPPQAGK